MADSVSQLVKTLVDHTEAGEWRRVRLVAGASVAVIEETSGPVTEAVYGCSFHGHKVLADASCFEQALGAGKGGAAAAIEGFFAAGADQGTLSELMDALDVAGQRYSYMTWSDEGDAALRAKP